MEMAKQLRSWAVKLKYIDNKLQDIGNKYYYNFIELPRSIDLDVKVIPYIFEYTENRNDNEVGFNFRMPQDENENISIIHNYLGELAAVYFDLFLLLGSPFKNVSSSIRILGEKTTNYTFYFYPTYIAESGKIKMKGLSRLDNCNSFLKKLGADCFYLQSCDQEEYESFVDLCVELRGISLCVEGKGYGYNIYIKCSHRELCSFLYKSFSGTIPEKSILAAIKIKKGRIVGYSIYYAGEYAKPCCGWGEFVE